MLALRFCTAELICTRFYTTLTSCKDKPSKRIESSGDDYYHRYLFVPEMMMILCEMR